MKMSKRVIVFIVCLLIGVCPCFQSSLASSDSRSCYVTNGGFEEPIIYDPWTIPGWGDGGRIGVESLSYVGKGIRLYQWSPEHGSDIWQVVYLDKKQLVLFFWLKPLPENHEINLSSF